MVTSGVRILQGTYELSNLLIRYRPLPKRKSKLLENTVPRYLDDLLYLEGPIKWVFIAQGGLGFQ